MPDFINSLPSAVLFITFCVLCSYVVISFAELLIHENLMHTKRLPKSIYQVWPYILEVFQAHAVRHHAHWYREFDFEPDPEGQMYNIKLRPIETAWALMLFSPVWLLFFAISPLLGAIFIIATLVHNQLWNILHTEMHMPSDGVLGKLAIYHWLARHHYMHHQFTNKNYNVAFPLADYIVGTQAKPRLRDLRQMMYLGYLTPKSAPAKSRVAAHRASVQKRRAPLLTPEMA